MPERLKTGHQTIRYVSGSVSPKIHMDRTLYESWFVVYYQDDEVVMGEAEVHIVPRLICPKQTEMPEVEIFDVPGAVIPREISSTHIYGMGFARFCTHGDQEQRDHQQHTDTDSHEGCFHAVLPPFVTLFYQLKRFAQ